MALRQPPQTLNPSGINPKAGLSWTTLHCELVTPMYGGGVKTHTVDDKMPVRAGAIRGQLRFWWRLLAQHKWRLGNPAAIRQAEAAIFGGIGDQVTASKVFLRVSGVQGLNVSPWAKYNINPNNGNYRPLPDPENWARVSYALFPAQGKRPGLPDSEDPHALAKPGMKWSLMLAFGPGVSDVQQKQVWEALRWWVNFGGLGARTRRGLGAFRVSGVVGNGAPSNLIKPISPQEAQEAGCRLLLRSPQSSADAAWQGAIRKLQEFRQLPSLARNPGSPRPGRSKWPEPDAIRRLTRRHESKHAPVHPAGNLFPRAAFGLPIIFHFQTREDPADSSLQPLVGQTLADRMASPVILKPYLTADKKWASAALLLPHGHVGRLVMQLKVGQSKFDAPYWERSQASHVPPIAQHGGGDALSAFMTFFSE